MSQPLEPPGQPPPWQPPPETPIEKLDRLIREIRTLEGAIGNFDGGGRITALIVGPTDGFNGPIRAPQTVDVSYMDYSQTMVDTIKAGLQHRFDQLNDELNQITTEERRR